MPRCHRWLAAVVLSCRCRVLLCAAHDTTHMGGGLQAFDEGRVRAKGEDVDVGVDTRSLDSVHTALGDLQLERCRLQANESICMAVLVSTIIFPFDVDALAYTCKNYRRSMFELIMYAAPLARPSIARPTPHATELGCTRTSR